MIAASIDKMKQQIGMEVQTIIAGKQDRNACANNGSLMLLDRGLLVRIKDRKCLPNKPQCPQYV
jgi:hypothetical protein